MGMYRRMDVIARYSGFDSRRPLQLEIRPNAGVFFVPSALTFEQGRCIVISSINRKRLLFLKNVYFFLVFMFIVYGFPNKSKLKFDLRLHLVKFCAIVQKLRRFFDFFDKIGLDFFACWM